MMLSVPLPTTPDGRVYRHSPNVLAQPRHFLLGKFDKDFALSPEARARMKLAPRSKQTVCPYSGVIAADSEFTHPDDLKAARKIVEHAAIADAQEELGRALSGLNTGRSRGGLINIEMKVSSSYRPKPRFARKDLLRELVCDHCSRDYGVYAIGLFCPDCGAPNLRLHFAREVELVRMQVQLAKSQPTTADELAYRLLGNAHEDVLTAFEATLKAVYLYGAATRASDGEEIKPIRNEFQNIEAGQRRFAKLGLNPFVGLNEHELATLRLNIQKRHVIGHNLGVIDAKFAEHSNEARVGETVRIVGDDVIAFATLCQRVMDFLDAWLVGSPAPTPAAIESEGTVTMETAMNIAQPVETRDVDDLNLELGPLAKRLALWLSRNSEDGLAEYAEGGALQAEFSNEPQEQLAEALAELEADGFVTTVHRGSHLPHVRLTSDLFATFDPVTICSDPVADSVTLANRVLEGSDDAVGVAELHAATEWPIRRFNPAIALVVAQIDDRRVSKVIQNIYPTMHIHLIASDRVALRRYVARIGG